jgi:transcriptional regulator with XRE-family HTH domain
MNREELERSINKSDRQLFINDLNTGFGLSQVEAEALYERITLFNRDYYEGSRAPGQITRTVVALGEPAGKPIKYCQLVSTNLTILHGQDTEIRQKFGIAAERRYKEMRLCDEAIEQGGVLTQEDLAILLGTSLSTIKRDDAYLLKQGISLLTRGTVEDIGRGVSHKAKAVELYLKNYTLSEIARKMGHSPSSVNRYLEDFEVVAFLHRESYPLLTIKKITKLSERLIKEYITLIERAEREGYSDRLDQLLDHFKVSRPFKKTSKEEV